VSAAFRSAYAQIIDSNRNWSRVSSPVFTSNRSPCEAYRWRFFQPRLSSF
jgi:hypothetical protein